MRRTWIEAEPSRRPLARDVTPSGPQAAVPSSRLRRSGLQRYRVETLKESLAEGIVTGHPAMPEFRLELNEVADFIAFLKSLER